MKKSTLIIILTLITALLASVWVYFIFFGTPEKTSEIFSDFGIGEDRELNPVSPEDTRVDVALDAGNAQNLRQLTIRPVAGAGFNEDGIRYIEQGTGHLYHINLSTGVETLVSGTTIPLTTHALFSTDSSYVTITSFGSTENTTIVAKIDTSKTGEEILEGITLPSGAREIAFGEVAGTVTYLLDSVLGAAGYSYNIEKKTSTQLFNISLRDVHVLWGTPTYVYTTPTALQDGSLYTVSNNKLSYVTNSAPALMGFRYNGGVIATKTLNKLTTSVAHPRTGDSIEQALGFIPEKCVINPTQEEIAFCAVPINRGSEIFPDDWYKGVLSYDDTLWSIDITSGAGTPLSMFKVESGREIDVISIGTNEFGDRIWFINKNDNTLWMFDMTI